MSFVGVQNSGVTGVINGSNGAVENDSNIGTNVNQNLTLKDNVGASTESGDVVNDNVTTSPAVESEEEDASDDLMKFMSSI